MKILIIGVSGFIGRHLYDALSQQGHHVMGCSRNKVANINWQKLDFNKSLADWEQQLHPFDIVINTAGIFHQSASQQFKQIHDIGPTKLFEACKKHSLKVIQISAIGAQLEKPATEFLSSKRKADQTLLEANEANIVLYPGIVLGERGQSTRQFSLLARLFCIPLAFGRNKELPLISIYQLTDHIIELINHWPSSKQANVLVAKAETMEHLLNNLRQWMSLGKGCFMAIPESLIKFTFFIFPKLSVGVFNKQSIAMLSSYSTTDIIPVTNETASDSLLKNNATINFNKTIRLKMLFYFNLITLSVIWVISGLSSLLNIEQSRELISLIGLKVSLGDPIIFIAAAGDIVLGIFLFLPRLRRWVIKLQISVIVIYSLIISIFIPLFWLHPFAPIIKNLAMVVLAFYLLIEDKE